MRTTQTRVSAVLAVSLLEGIPLLAPQASQAQAPPKVIRTVKSQLYTWRNVQIAAGAS